jgi:hypothetical protein
MNLINKLITEMFTCPHPLYKMSAVSLSYRTCIGRQKAKSDYGKLSYPECATCLYGKEIKRHFKGYKPIKNKIVRATKNVTGTRLSKGESLFSPHCIVKSQVSLDNAPDKNNRSKVLSKKSVNVNYGRGKLSEPEIKSKQTLDELIHRSKAISK